MAKIPSRKSVQRSMGTTSLTSGLEAAFRDFVGHHALPKSTELQMLRDAYKNFKADQNIKLPHDEAELAPVEEAIGYRFTNKKLLEWALTSPIKGDPGQDYNRLDTLQAVCIDIGLKDYIRRYDEETEAKIAVLKASYPLLKQQSGNKAYWRQGLLFPSKTAFTVGAKLLKMYLGLHFYTTNPKGGPGPLTISRDKELRKIKNRDHVCRVVGSALVEDGLQASFTTFLGLHPIPGITNWQTLVDAYRSSKADKNIGLSYDPERLAEVEATIDYLD
ncbi:MAG: hypothetical protein J3Q66DRAFT_434280 [Benniella sp.]|nr:MAG: hypothetical protein J3Q66DRAFT_434280 [Benniella sp.]